MGLLRPGAKVEVHLEENIVWLHPDSVNNPSPLVKDPLVRGNVVLILAKPRVISSIVVHLSSVCDLKITSEQWDSSVLWQESAELLKGGTRLEAGEHRFSFRCAITDSGAPAERSMYGRVSQKVYASVKGLGPAGTDLVSSEVFAAFVCNPNPFGGLPPPLEMIVEGFDEDLGLWQIRASSPSLTVASLLESEVHFRGPPTDVQLDNVECVIVQTFLLRPPRNPTKEIEPAPVKAQVFKLEGPPSVSKKAKTRPLAQLIQGKPHLISHIARLPNSNRIRPSTHECTISPITVKSQLYYVFSYTTPDGKPRAKAIHRSVDIASCYCRKETLTLPSYSPNDPNPSAERFDWKARPTLGNASLLCNCGHTFEHLIQETSQNMAADPSDGRQTLDPAPKRSSASPSTRDAIQLPSPS